MDFNTAVICATVLVSLWLIAHYSLRAVIASLRAEDKNRTQDLADMVSELEGRVKGLSQQVNQDIKKLMR